MFERYTDQARRAIFFARHEAKEFGSPLIGPEHLLLGILREYKQFIDLVLPRVGSVNAVREAIQRNTLPRPQISSSLDLPLSDQSKRVLAHAAEESGKVNHKHIDGNRLLLGILSEPASFAAKLLREYGVESDQLRKRLEAVPDLETRRARSS